MPAEERARRLFASEFGGDPAAVVRAPGRVNIIGDHTDYNDGFVLPMAIAPATWIAFRPRADGAVSLASDGFGRARFSLDKLEHGGPPWVEYVKGVAWALGPASLTGWEGAIATDVPTGAGLSSSAALELATALAFAVASAREFDPVAAAVASQRAENEWVGMSCGIMDQLSAAMGVAGHALLIDCRTLRVTPHRLPSSVAIAVLDTGTRRRLVDSAYNDRRATCEAVARAYGVAALRDLDVADLDEPPAGLPPSSLRRARHVVTENTRVLDAAAALSAGDGAALGRLATQSHRSLRDDYEVSSPELNAIVELALSAPGCLGARMTGAGFGGSAIALVDAGAIDDFTAALGGQPVMVTAPAQGAAVVAAEGIR